MFSEYASHSLMSKQKIKEEEERRLKAGQPVVSGAQISEADWNKFVKDDKVSEVLLDTVVDRIVSGQKMSDRERAIYLARTAEIEARTQKKQQEILSEKKLQISSYQMPEADMTGITADKETPVAAIAQKAGEDLSGAKDKSLEKLDKASQLVFTAGIIDTTDIASGRARRTAHEQMTAEKKELTGVKGFFKKVFKYNYGEQLIHEKRRVTAKEKILTAGNIYSGENLTDAEKTAAGRKFSELTVGRFLSEAREMIEENLGERRSELASVTPEERKVKAELKKIIDDYADGRLDEAGFEGAKRQVFVDIEKLDTQNTLKKSEMQVDNLLEIAKQVKELKQRMAGVAGHQAGLDKLDYDINIVLGKAKEGIKTEAHYNWAEKTVENLRRTKLGSLVNETTLAVSVAAVYSAVEGVGKFLGSRTAAAVTFGLSAGVAGVFSAVKEGQMQKRERETLEARETVGVGQIRERLAETRRELSSLEAARDKTTDKKELKSLKKEIKSRRAEEEKLNAQEKFIYERRTAGELTSKLEEAAKGSDPDELISHLAEIESRLGLSNQNKIDLIGYSGTGAVEEERAALLAARVNAKRRLAELQTGGAAGGRDLAAILKTAADLRIDQLTKDRGGLNDRDKSFRKYKNKAVFKKITQVVGTGLVLGATIQEAISFLSDHQEGVVEHLIKGDNRTLGAHDTALEALKNYIGGGSAATEQLQEVAVVGGTVKLPASCSWLQNPDGSYSVLRGSDVLADGLHFNPDGSLTDQAKEILAGNDIAITETQHLIDQGTATETVTTTPNDYIAKHPDQFEEISRQRWNANDTPMYQGEDGKWYGADLNERLLDWGGDNRTGINTETGAYEMSAFRMTPDGSFQTINGLKLSDNATEMIKEGKMSILFSLSAETQNQVIEVPIDPATGKISIPQDSDLGKLLFADENGRAVLKAKFAEVAFTSGELENGVKQVRLFATAVGEGLKEVTDTVTTAKPPLVTTISGLGVDRTWIMQPFVPFGMRTPLTPIPEIAPIYNIYNAQPVEGAAREKMDKRRSETLEKNPRAKLDHYKEAEKYLGKLDKAYLDEVETLAQAAGPMSEKNKLSVCIPVAGHQEGKKIYDSLKNYTYQSADKKSFEICLLVNHPDRDMQGRKVKPDKTLSEIKRFKKDYPDVQVKVMYKVLPREQANIGLVRKLLSDSVLCRHHDRGKDAPDLLMVSNDADNLGLDPRYVQNFIDRFSANPELDGMLGQLDWDPEAYVKYPLVHVGTRIFQYYSAYGRATRGGIVSSGANFAYRSSIYSGIGGYLDDVPGGEDVALGQAIALARGSVKNGIRGTSYETQGHGGSASRLFTSARRAIDVLKKYGLAPVEQWDKGFSPFDDEIRRMDLNDSSEKEIDYKNKAWQKKFKENLEHIINRTLDVYERGEKIGKKRSLYRKEILSRLGIEYNLDANKNVVITNMSKLIEGLILYQKEGVLQRDARSGKPEAAAELKNTRQSRVDLENKRRKEFEKQAAKEAEGERQVIEQNDLALGDFYKNDKLAFKVSPDMQVIKPEDNGEDTTDLDGEYVRRNKAVITDTENGRVSAGYEKNTKKAVVIKENPKSGLSKKGPEQYLAKLKFQDPALLLPLKTIDSKDKVTRIYEAAETDLDRYLKKQADYQLSPKDALSVIIRLSDVTGKLHKMNMVHGDIHPGNVYLFKEGIKLGDIDEAYVGKFVKKGMGGNRFIMTPEMFVEEDRGVSFEKNIDIYALCSSLYKMIVGRWPHQIVDNKMTIEEKQAKYKDLHENEKVDYPDSVPVSLRPILEKGLAVKPADRYKSINYFLQDLLSIYNKL